MSMKISLMYPGLVNLGPSGPATISVVSYTLYQRATFELFKRFNVPGRKRKTLVSGQPRVIQCVILGLLSVHPFNTSNGTTEPRL